MSDNLQKFDDVAKAEIDVAIGLIPAIEKDLAEDKKGWNAKQKQGWTAILRMCNYMKLLKEGKAVMLSWPLGDTQLNNLRDEMVKSKDITPTEIVRVLARDNMLVEK